MILRHEVAQQRRIHYGSNPVMMRF